MSASDNPETGRVVSFPGTEEHARRLRVEVERLARLPVVEWMLYLDDTAKKHGIDKATLKTMVEAVVKELEKKAREDRGELRRHRSASRSVRTARRSASRNARTARPRGKKSVKTARPGGKKSVKAARSRRRSRPSSSCRAPNTRPSSRRWRANSGRTSKSCAKSSLRCAARRKRGSNAVRLSRGTRQSTRGNYSTR
jgi:hypothetical protein